MVYPINTLPGYHHLPWIYHYILYIPMIVHYVYLHYIPIYLGSTAHLIEYV